MNRAIALAELDGPQAGVDALATVNLDTFNLFHATRAELYRRLGQRDDALDAYDLAIELATNDAERRYLTRRRAMAATE
jgi:RNA polymerase sigma-70 factor, ECF subfamily